MSLECLHLITIIIAVVHETTITTIITTTNTVKETPVSPIGKGCFRDVAGKKLDFNYMKLSKLYLHVYTLHACYLHIICMFIGCMIF